MHDALTVKVLKTLAKHGAVAFFEHARRQVNYAAGVDAKNIAVVREMVDRTESQPVADHRRSLLMCVLDDVGCLNQRPLSEGTDRASVAVRAEHLEAELMLMQSVFHLPNGVTPDVSIGSNPCRIVPLCSSKVSS